MVGVLLGDQHAVQPIDLRLKQLLAQIWRAVDKNARNVTLPLRAFH